MNGLLKTRSSRMRLQAELTMNVLAQGNDAITMLENPRYIWKVLPYREAATFTFRPRL